MIFYIESVYGDILLHGKGIGESELREKTKEIFNLVSEKEFPSAFGMRYGYEVIPFDPHVKVDYVIDLDTHWVYKPVYNT
ncbi:MAG: hypothetical protein PHV95_03820 [Eubacteriales bacterium]|nr:hypothetical protein [Eubacteriales bacterium]